MGLAQTQDMDKDMDRTVGGVGWGERGGAALAEKATRPSGGSLFARSPLGTPSAAAATHPPAPPPTALRGGGGLRATERWRTPPTLGGASLTDALAAALD